MRARSCPSRIAHQAGDATAFAVTWFDHRRLDGDDRQSDRLPNPVQLGPGGKVRLPLPTYVEVYLTMRSLITTALVRATRRLAGRYVWTHPNIARTFHCRPTYHASFKNTWLSLMWGGEAGTRRLRESIAVAVSVANQCFY